MYERYFGLRERPFKLTSNPRYFLLTAKHAEALSALQYGISSRMGIVVLVGEAGTGKTTVVRAALSSQPAESRFVLINNPLLSTDDFFRLLVDGFGLSAAAAASKPRLLAELTGTLDAGYQSGMPCGLIVDEAHALPHDLLEQIRLLANIECDEDKLLPVVLVGQPELGDRLNEPHLRQLKQRVSLRCTLDKLNMTETAAYVAGRISVAGGDGAAIFSRAAVDAIYRGSGGIPRVISVICENALVTAFGADERPISDWTIRAVCADLDLEPAGTPDPRTLASAGIAGSGDGAQPSDQ
jgi:general secretion pathway protein A